eukprot:5525053-Amphidinium_carterae.1
MELAFVSDLQHDREAFAKWVDEALKVRPDSPQAWIYRAMCDENVADYEKAHRSYSRAKELDPLGAYGRDAASQIALLERNMGCKFVAAGNWANAAPRILGQQAREQPIEHDLSVMVPQRPLFHGDECVHVWEAVFGPDMLTELLRSVDAFSTFLSRNPQQCRTFWLPRDAKPSTAAELAGRLLLEHVLKLP